MWNPLAEGKKKPTKVGKDTLMFNFDKEYLELGTLFDDEYITTDDINRKEGISYKVKKIHFNLKVNKIYNLKEFVNKIDSFETTSRVNSKQGKLFNRLNDNVVFFVDNGRLKFMEMTISLYTVD